MPIRTFQFRGQAVVGASAGTTINRSVTQDLELEDDGFPGFRLLAESDLGFLDGVIFIFQPSGVNSVKQNLGLSDEVHVFGYEVTGNTLALTDEVEEKFPISFERNSNLLLSDEVVFSWGVRYFENIDAWGVTDGVALAIDASAANALGLVDSASRFTYHLGDTLFTDEANWGYGKDASNDLGLTDLAEKTQNLRKGLTDEDFLSQSASWYVENPCNKLRFKTFHGTGGVEPTPAKLNYKSSFLLQSRDDGEIVRLRNPETDDRRRVSFNRTNRRFFDNSLDLFADDSWAIEEVQIYTITATKRADLDTLFVFLDNNLGREIMLKDWRGVTWQVVITNPGEVYTEDGEGVWTLDFEVSGTAFDGEWVFESLPVTDVVSRAGSIYRRGGSDTDILSHGVGRNYDETIEPPDDGAVLGVSDAASFVKVTP